MDNLLTTALSIVGVAIVVLILVLSAFGGIVWVFTAIFKDAPEKTEDSPAVVLEATAPEVAEPASDLKIRAALAAIAIARAQAEMSGQVVSADGEAGSSWQQFYRNRRLNQFIPTRRTS